ncbi:MAG: DUF6785 family protein [Armatimonadota bacterium]
MHPASFTTNSEGLRPRARVLWLVLLLEVVFQAWIADSEIRRNVYLICYALMMPTVLLLVVGPLIRAAMGLRTGELLFVYAVLTTTLPVAGFGAVRFLVPGMGYVPHAAESDAGLARFLPSWAGFPVLHEALPIRLLYRSGPVDWSSWTPPIAFWSGYLVLLAAAWLGIGWLVRRAWIEEERLSFPVAQIALEWTSAQDPAWRRPGFVVGAAIPLVLQSLLALHEWIPSVPAFELKAWNAREVLFPNPPWSAIPDVPVGLYPMAIGLAYFMPTPVAFSCCFFWIAVRLAHVAGFALGLGQGGGGEAARFPYVPEQGAGAWIAMALLTLLALRRKGADRSAAARRRDRWVMVGTVSCLIAAAGFQMRCGIPAGLAVATVAVATAYMITAARVRAESGAIWTFSPLGWTPGRVALEAFRAGPYPASTLGASALFDLVHVDVRGQSLPYLIEGLRTSREAPFRARDLIVWSAVFTLVGLGLAWWFQIMATHAVGAAGAGANPYALAKVRVAFQSALAAGRPERPDGAGIGAALVGMAVTTLLQWGRARWFAFPFHPVGYVLGLTLTTNAFFVPILIALVVRSVVLRYGGAHIHRRSVAFFVGLVLGDMAIQTFWALLGRAMDAPVYPFLS